MTSRHSSIVLFYKYFLPSDYPLLHQYGNYYEEKLQQFQKELCDRLALKGRVLIASEGINGTVSAESPGVLKTFIDTMERFDLFHEFGVPQNGSSQVVAAQRENDYHIFRNIDWKTSSNHEGILEPFPDIKVTIVKEIISSGGTVSVDDINAHGGKHLSPSEFHRAILENPDAVVIDVRNTFEYEIGHFVNPTLQTPAVNPEMVTFSSFDSTFCERNAADFKGKKVLLYCTGGIRCEKASVMLKKRGIVDVSQLEGGIHRYLEEFGNQGLFRGLNFVFDQRVAMRSSVCPQTHDVVGKCSGCQVAYDELCGSRVCTVCRDLILVCPVCQGQLREYHCTRHSSWKDCYYTFLESFSKDVLLQQKTELSRLRQTYVPAANHKNVRRTISRQIEKVSLRIERLDTGLEVINSNAPRRCRTCMEPTTVCDGRCWGFWKTKQSLSSTEIDISTIPQVESISIGDSVRPGGHWNELRFGSKFDSDGKLRYGVVVELKSWGSGSQENDCVAVRWRNSKQAEPLIYRWGVVSRNGIRMYDLERINSIASC